MCPDKRRQPKRVHLAAMGLILSLVSGCEKEPSALNPPQEDVSTSDALGPVAERRDALRVESTEDADTEREVSEELPLPTPDSKLYAGFAEAPLAFPIGSPAVGYGPKQGPKTPYAESYPGTNAEHTKLKAKAMVLRAANKTLALVRVDLIGIWQGMVRDAQARLRERGHPELAKGLIVAATHTHRSGGRIFDHFIGEIAVGPFLEGFYPRVRDAIVEAAIEAATQAIPARIGHTSMQVPSLHSDRRCEHNPSQDDTLGILKVESREGELMGVVLNYAMHGTVLGNEEFVLSTDAPGAMEDGLEASMQSPAMVLYLQSWAGDMAPESPDSHAIQAGHDLRDSYKELRAIAAEAAALVEPVIAATPTKEDVKVDVVTIALPLNNALINPEGSFDAYPHGGIYCMDSAENCGDAAEAFVDAQLTCVPIPEEYSVPWTLLSAAQVGELVLVTLPGEPSTSIGSELRQRALEATGLDEVFVVGYSQSYLSYLLHPEDYWMGGYEGASALMGPGFGAYLIEKSVNLARHLITPEESPIPLVYPLEEVQEALDYAPLSYEEAAGEAAILQEPTLSEGVWSFSWRGGDPAVDAPTLRVERMEEGAWVDASYASGRPITGAGPEFELTLAPVPSYEENASPDAREFIWTMRLPDLFSVPGPSTLRGSLRLIVRGERPEPYELTSAQFER